VTKVNFYILHLSFFGFTFNFFFDALDLSKSNWPPLNLKVIFCDIRVFNKYLHELFSKEK